MEKKPAPLMRKITSSTAALSCMAALLLPDILWGEGAGALKVVKIPYAHFDRLLVTDENNTPVSGYAYDFIQTIATYAGWDVEYVPADGFGECVEKLLSGEVDLFYDVSYTEERSKMILFPDEPMGFEYYYLYALEDNDSIFPGDHESLKGKTVGVTVGTMVPDLLREWCRKKNVDLKFVEYKEIPKKEADLFAGKIDLDLEISMLAKPNLSAIEKIGSSAYYLVANKERQDLIDDINSAMTKVINNDLFYFSRLQEIYFADTVQSRNLTHEEKSWLADHKVLRVGFFDKYLPFSAKDENGNPIGAGIDAIREIVRHLKLDESLKVEFICYDNQKEGYRAVESGEIDMMFPAYISNTVKKDYRIIGGKIMATLASDLAFSDNYNESKVKRIGVNRNNLMQYYYTRDSHPESEIVLFDGIRECLDGVLDGKADGVFLNGFRSAALLKPNKYNSLDTVRAKNDFQFRLAFSEGNIGLMLLMNRGLAMLDHDFTNKAAYSYVRRIYTFSMMDFIREHVLTAILIIAFLAAMAVALVNYRASNRKLAVINKELTENTETIEKQRQQETELRKQLEDALKMAQSANRAKTAFLSNMSHDIRTPMNAIIGFTDLAINHIDDTPRVKEYLETIGQSSEHLLSLINDILDMSRIESGKMVLNEKEESLADILHVLHDLVRAAVQAKKHDFSIDMEDVRDDRVYCDKLRLNQVLLNMLSKAIKYTRPGGKISLRVMQKSVSASGYGIFEFRCKDNGIGMSEEFAKTIFDSFTREENSTTSGIQGTGLGMAIAKNLVEMMGGRISVTSKKGEGTEFVVVVGFKLAEKKAAAPAAPDANGSRGKVGDGGAGARKGGADKPFSLKGKRVLMADDSDLNLKIGVLLLQEQGLVIETAKNGQIAVDKIREKGVDAYDFVLMDVQMPVLDGYGATAAIRKLPGGDKLKIIAYSANAFEEDREASLKAGMNGHIAKPLKINELLDELRRFAV